MTINEAIFTVITTKYKKDAKEAHKIIDEAGLEAYKRDGAYSVCDPETHKRIDCNILYGTIYLYTAGQPVQRIKPQNGQKVDYKHYLETPWNIDWQNVIYPHPWDRSGSKALQAYERIKDKKRMISNTKERIARIKRDLERLQNELIEENLDLARYENDLEALISSFGLTKKGA